MPRFLWFRTVIFAGLVGAAAACTPPPSSELAIHNDSDSRLFVRLEGASGVAALIYRVDPGASGLAVAPSNEQRGSGQRGVYGAPATRLIVLDADCKQLSAEDNPQLGSMDVDRDGNLSFNVGMRRRESWMDVLPTVKSCR
jgi:hypothetical protein